MEGVFVFSFFTLLRLFISAFNAFKPVSRLLHSARAEGSMWVNVGECTEKKIKKYRRRLKSDS